jgi:hypothetical protein
VAERIPKQRESLARCGLEQFVANRIPEQRGSLLQGSMGLKYHNFLPCIQKAVLLVLCLSHMYLQMRWQFPSQAFSFIAASQSQITNSELEKCSGVKEIANFPTKSYIVTSTV